MKHAIAQVLAAMLFFVGANAMAADETSRQRSLQHLKGVKSVLVHFHEPFNELQRSVGLANQTILTDIELKLRGAGIRIANDPPGDPDSDAWFVLRIEIFGHRVVGSGEPDFLCNLFFSMSSCSFRSLEPSLSSSGQSVQTRLTGHSVRRQDLSDFWANLLRDGSGSRLRRGRVA
jgi:hypothetical protein